MPETQKEEEKDEKVEEGEEEGVGMPVSDVGLSVDAQPLCIWMARSINICVLLVAVALPRPCVGRLVCQHDCIKTTE